MSITGKMLVPRKIGAVKLKESRPGRRSRAFLLNRPGPEVILKARVEKKVDPGHRVFFRQRPLPGETEHV